MTVEELIAVLQHQFPEDSVVIPVDSPKVDFQVVRTCKAVIRQVGPDEDNMRCVLLTDEEF